MPDFLEVGADLSEIKKLKLNDNLRFTLHEEAGTAIFDVEVNPTD